LTVGGVADVVILDFRRVTVIDATGALLIESIARRLASRGTGRCCSSASRHRAGMARR
jgi:anti-anti-sigma regulatory factor